MNDNKTYPELNDYIKNLHLSNNSEDSVEIAIQAANECLKIIFPKNNDGKYWSDALCEGEEALEKYIPSTTFPNSKVQNWFGKHPFVAEERTALELFSETDCPVEAKFYWLNKSSAKSRISAGVALSQNWEDDNLTKNENYKVGIDFFLTSDTNSILMVLSNEGKLRVMEMAERLTNTQIEIFNSIDGVAGLECMDKELPQSLIHKKLWDAFELRSINSKFYEGISTYFQILLQHLEKSGKNTDEAKVFVNRLIGRLLFLWFLNKKGFIDKEQEYFDCYKKNATEYYENTLKQLFYATLNTPKENRFESANGMIDDFTPYLNGGLFEPHASDWPDELINFPDTWFEELYGHFNKFNFTTDESTPEFEQVAIDPEMLGRVFENLLASQLDETGKEARKASGSFYTPREIVTFMCRESLRTHIKTKLANEALEEGVDKLLDTSDSVFEVNHSNSRKYLWGEKRTPEITKQVVKILKEIKIIDPACGSGAFPMGIVQELLRLYERLNAIDDTYQTKLDILANNIYGVDIQPMAVEIARLRAWLSLIVDEDSVKNVRALPNLDFKFVCADSLVPLEKNTERYEYQVSFLDSDDEKDEQDLAENRNKYFKADNLDDKLSLKNAYYDKIRSIEDKEKKDNCKRNNYIQQIKQWDPFDLMKTASFFDSDQMFGIKDGFDICLGNPPYVHLESIKDVANKKYKPLNFKTYEARGDLYVLFFERSLDFLKEGGILSFITSNKWMRANYGAKLRDFFIKNSQPLLLADLGGGVFESATVDTDILMLSKSEYVEPTRAVKVQGDFSTKGLKSYISENSLEIVFKEGQFWVILTPIEQSIKEKIESVGTPLKDWDIKISRGILTGCNEAFIVSTEKRDEILANCKTEEERERTAELIRPILRGRDIKRYHCEWAGIWLINTHNGYINHDGNNVPAIDIDKFPAIKDHLNEYYDELKPRTDQGCTPYNLRNCAYMDDFSKPLIAWKAVGRNLSFALTEGNFVITAPACFINANKYSNYLLAALSSNVIKYYIFRNSDTTGAGDIMLNVQSLIKIPIPKVCNPLVDKCIKSIVYKYNPKQEKIINNEFYKAYSFSDDEITYIESQLN